MPSKDLPETPEEHVHESVERQEIAAKEVKRAASKVAKDAAEKATVLAIATEALSKRVGTLADVVQMNNAKIDALTTEVNKKPDDVEVQFIAGLASKERKKQYKDSIIGAAAVAIIASGVAFFVSDLQNQERCKTNSQNIHSIVRLLESVDNPRFQGTIDDLKSNRNSC